jgi:RNase H-like domain found in reverse transcriptase
VLVISAECLTTIDHECPGENKIFVTCDASDWHIGATLSFSQTWETARPVTFDSMQLKPAEKNYPIHEKELLAIICALKKWCSDLLGTHFYVYTDHQTLENFDTQKDLSRRQLHWQEFMSQYDLTITYIRGEDNTVADVLSRLPPNCFLNKVTPLVTVESVNAILTITSDHDILE